MSTPAIRAIARSLSLPLLVPLVRGADDHHPAMPADDLAPLTDRLHARTYFHETSFCCSSLRLLVAIGDPTSLEVVRGDLNLDPVAREDADPMHAHLSRAVCQHLVAVFELDLEHRVREGLDDDSLQHDCIFLGLGQQDLLIKRVRGPGGAESAPTRDGPARNSTAGPGTTANSAKMFRAPDADHRRGADSRAPRPG